MDALETLARNIARNCDGPKEPPEYMISFSGGNDSWAILLHLIATVDPKGICVVYLDTGWGRPDWFDKRVAPAFDLISRHGGTAFVVPSMGFDALVKKKQGFPRNGMQFCTQLLKRVPFLEWAGEYDPDGESTVVLGIRREESRARHQWPEWVEDSENHGGRSLWSPIVRMTTLERDRMLTSFGVPILPFRSMECYPCINSNRAQLRLLNAEAIAKVEMLEEFLDSAYGKTQSGARRLMFRSASKMGAEGIREVIRWADAERGKFVAGAEEYEGGCDSGLCGN